MTSEDIDQSGDRGQDEARGRGELRCSDRNPWALYDEMIAGIPEGVAVTDFCVGRSWCYVVADCGMGIGHTVTGGARRAQGLMASAVPEWAQGAPQTSRRRPALASEFLCALLPHAAILLLAT